MVGYNVQAAVDTKHHLIVAHEVTNEGTDRAQLAKRAEQTKAVLETDTLDVVADRGYFNGKEILACAEAEYHGHPSQASNLGQQSQGPICQSRTFVYCEARTMSIICPCRRNVLGLPLHKPWKTGLTLRRYWTANGSGACQGCAMKDRCTTGKERRITRWEHEHVLEAVERRLDEHPQMMRTRRETVEHPVRNHQVVDGGDPLPDAHPQEGRHRDGLARAGLQSQKGHEDHRHRPVDPSYERGIGARRRPFTPLSG